MAARSLSILGLSLLALTGCNAGYYPAPYGAEITMGEAVSLSASEAFLYEDAIGALIFASAAVTLEDVPMNNIEVEVMSFWSGVYLIPEAAIKLVDYPTPGQGVEDAESAKEACDQDGDGYIDADAADWCSWWWDTETGQYYEFGVDYAETDQDFRPTYMTTGTNDRGLVNFYLYVDSLPATIAEAEDGAATIADVSWTQVEIWASIGVSDDSIQIGVSQ